MPVGTTVVLPSFTSTAAGLGPQNMPLSSFAFFQDTTGSDTFSGRLSAAGTKLIQVPSTFSDQIRTDANGTITVTYVCETSSLTCNYKHLDGQSTLQYPAGTTFSPPKEVTVEVSFTNGPVAQTIQVRDTLPNSHWAYKTNSTQQTAPGTVYISGNPTGAPGGPLTWTSATEVPASTTVVFHFTATIDAMTAGQM